MAQCILDTAIIDGFEKIKTMKMPEVDRLFADYDRAVFAQPVCAQPDNYILIAEQFQRHKRFDLASLALAKAMLSAPSYRMPYARIADVYEKLGLKEASGVLRYVSKVRIDGETTVAAASGGETEYWKSLACNEALDRCDIELQGIQTSFNQSIKHYVLLSLHASYLHIPAHPSDIIAWVMDPMTIAAWKRDPSIVVDTLDYFIKKQGLEAVNGMAGEMSNPLLVIRDLMKLTAQFTWTKPVHHDDPRAIFKPYQDVNGILFPAVRKGVTYYLLFLLQMSGAQVPDAELLATLEKISGNRDVVERVKLLAKSRQESLSPKPLRGKK